MNAVSVIVRIFCSSRNRKPNLPDMTREEVIEKKEFPVLVVDRPCGLELFHVSTEEPTSEGPPLELWECPMGHRTHFLSKKEESKSSAKIRARASRSNPWFPA